MTDAREQLINRFAGKWKMSRIIKDYRADAVGSLEGYAEFLVEGDGLTVAERGILTMGDFSTEATRRWYWSFPTSGEDAGKIAVHFDDGRICHAFDAEAAAPRAYHWCEPDDYHVTYEWRDKGSWKTVWRVTGPRKDYRMETVYSRA